MMSLKSVMLMVLALVFFAAGGYLFYTSTQECLGLKSADNPSNPEESAHAAIPMITPALSE